MQRSERLEFRVPAAYQPTPSLFSVLAKNPPLFGGRRDSYGVLGGWATYKFDWIFGAEIDRTPLWVNTPSCSIVLALQWWEKLQSLS